MSAAHATRRRRHRRVLLALAAVSTGAWCGWVSGFRLGSVPAKVTWAASLAAVVVVDLSLWAGRQGWPGGLRLYRAAQPWPRPGREGWKSTVRGTLPWTGLVLAAATWEALGIATGTHVPHLTVSALAKRYRPLDAVALLVWIGVGVVYGVARARAVVGGASTERAGSGEHGTGAVPMFASVGTVHLPMVPALLLPAARAVGVGFWAAWAAAWLIVEAASHATSGRLASTEDLVRFLTRSKAVDVVLVAAWTYAGWHLFAH